ncbi:MAG TPA: hemin uptake protein HemP [Hyphomicrobiaceae bacterium]|nr:hemin uptake protein HemP [Hyphomicrobiaceae bacterium]
MERSNDVKETPSPQSGRPLAAQPRRHKVSDLLQGNREAILEHGGQDYRLRITANGKLILTK